MIERPFHNRCLHRQELSGSAHESSLWGMVGCRLALLCFLLVSLTRLRRAGVQSSIWKLRHVALIAALAAFLLASLSCGSSSSSGGGGGSTSPQPESGTVTITGTSSSPSVTHTAQISVSVS